MLCTCFSVTQQCRLHGTCIITVCSCSNMTAVCIWLPMQALCWTTDSISALFLW
jgi:hypothetical protein